MTEDNYLVGKFLPIVVFFKSRLRSILMRMVFWMLLPVIPTRWLFEPLLCSGISRPQKIPHLRFCLLHTCPPLLIAISSVLHTIARYPDCQPHFNPLRIQSSLLPNLAFPPSLHLVLSIWFPCLICSRFACPFPPSVDFVPSLYCIPFLVYTSSSLSYSYTTSPSNSSLLILVLLIIYRSLFHVPLIPHPL